MTRQKQLLAPVSHRWHKLNKFLTKFLVQNLVYWLTGQQHQVLTHPGLTLLNVNICRSYTIVQKGRTSQQCQSTLYIWCPWCNCNYIIGMRRRRMTSWPLWSCAGLLWWEWRGEVGRKGRGGEGDHEATWKSGVFMLFTPYTAGPVCEYYVHLVVATPIYTSPVDSGILVTGTWNLL